jgi:hypothetical protein
MIPARVYRLDSRCPRKIWGFNIQRRQLRAFSGRHKTPQRIQLPDVVVRVHMVRIHRPLRPIE